MQKLNLVLADTDEKYIESLGRFIRSSYANKFNVSIFTQVDSLMEFLDNNNRKTDILMISPEFYFEQIKEFKNGVVILLSDYHSSRLIDGLQCVNKYQTGEVILSSMLEHYSNLNPSAGSIVEDGRETKLVSFFSPVGGSGKTTISIALSALLAKMGKKVLYLNLETVNSMAFYIKNPNQEKGMSNLLFYLKENKKTLSIKIDSLKSFNSDLGISYFGPADCSLEMDELTQADIETLLYELKKIGQFDFVVVDTDSTLDGRNLAVLMSSDSIVVPITQDCMAKHKLELFKKELKKISSNGERMACGRIISVINKYQSGVTLEEPLLEDNWVYTKIPLLKDIDFYGSGKQALGLGNSIYKHIEELAGLILENV